MGRRSTKISAWIDDHSAYWQVETMRSGYYTQGKLRALSDDELKEFFYLIQSMTKELRTEVQRRKDED